jgi:glyoxylase-like metal-dependent hydrolase (beta-lactamase superfamily II)
MFQSRRIGDATVTRVLEYSGPTHDPKYLFPDFDPAVMAQNDWVAPDHWVPAMHKFVVTLQIWVVQAGGNVIVVDTGVGNTKPRARVPRMHMLNTLVLPWLHAAGLPREQVTHVVMTHLHGDHVGWNTLLDGDRWVPTFPNARYLMPREDFAFFSRQYEERPQNNAAYEDSVVPVLHAGLVEFFGPGDELAGCLQVEAAPGHTPGQVNLRLRSQGEEALFCADVMHNPIQVAQPQWNSAYCIIGDVARSTRLGVLDRAADRNALLIPAHFGAPYCGYIRREGDGYLFEPATW